MDTEMRAFGASFGSSYPVSVAVLGWIPFVVVILLSFTFAAVYIHYFWKKHERDRLSAVTATLGLWIALITALLLPVDVFLTSFMKNSDGTFKDWATNVTRTSVENSMTYTYYTFYALILAFAFFFLPLVYFAYEEKDDEFDSMSQRLCAGLRYTSVFFLFAIILFVTGALIPYETYSKGNSTVNMTEWEKLQAALNEVYINKGEEAMIFTLNVLTIIGMGALVLYTGIGLSAFPIQSLRGWRNLSAEMEIIRARREDLEARIGVIRARGERSNLSSRDQRNLTELQEELHLVTRMETTGGRETSKWWYKLRPVGRVFDVSLGVISMAFGLLLWLSLLIVNIDKVMHSLGYKSGYLLPDISIFNPFGYIMVQSQRVFPVDYILYCAIVVFLVSCTIAGIRFIGIWCLCLKMFKIRPHRTVPQALIILCVILMYVVLALNILMYEVIPQYTTFGSQHYQQYNATSNVTKAVPCSHLAPEGECIMTRASVFIVQYAVKASFFATVYYYMSWVFLGMVILGFFVVIISRKKSYLEEAVDRDDFDESDTDERPLVP